MTRSWQYHRWSTPSFVRITLHFSTTAKGLKPSAYQGGSDRRTDWLRSDCQNIAYIQQYLSDLCITYVQAASLPTAAALTSTAPPRQPGSHPTSPTLPPPPESVPRASTAGTSSSAASSDLEAPSGMVRGAPNPTQPSPLPAPMNNADNAGVQSSFQAAPVWPLGDVTTYARISTPLWSMCTAFNTDSSSTVLAEAQGDFGVKQDLDEGSPIRGLLMPNLHPSTSAQNTATDQLEKLPKLQLPHSSSLLSSPSSSRQTSACHPMGSPSGPLTAHQVNDKGTLGLFQGFAKPAALASELFEAWAPAFSKHETVIPALAERPSEKAPPLALSFKTEGKTSNPSFVNQGPPSPPSTAKGNPLMNSSLPVSHQSVQPAYASAQGAHSNALVPSDTPQNRPASSLLGSHAPPSSGHKGTLHERITRFLTPMKSIPPSPVPMDISPGVPSVISPAVPSTPGALGATSSHAAKLSSSHKAPVRTAAIIAHNPGQPAGNSPKDATSLSPNNSAASSMKALISHGFKPTTASSNNTVRSRFGCPTAVGEGTSSPVKGKAVFDHFARSVEANSLAAVSQEPSQDYRAIMSKLAVSRPAEPRRAHIASFLGPAQQQCRAAAQALIKPAADEVQRSNPFARFGLKSVTGPVAPSALPHRTQLGEGLRLKGIRTRPAGKEDSTEIHSPRKAVLAADSSISSSLVQRPAAPSKQQADAGIALRNPFGAAAVRQVETLTANRAFSSQLAFTATPKLSPANSISHNTSSDVSCPKMVLRDSISHRGSCSGVESHTCIRKLSPAISTNTTAVAHRLPLPSSSSGVEFRCSPKLSPAISTNTTAIAHPLPLPGSSSTGVTNITAQAGFGLPLGGSPQERTAPEAPMADPYKPVPFCMPPMQSQFNALPDIAGPPPNTLVAPQRAHALAQSCPLSPSSQRPRPLQSLEAHASCL